MTGRTDHTARAVAGRAAATPGTGRQVALAASVALLTVTGTATIAWSALTVALGPHGGELGTASKPPRGDTDPGQTTALRDFAGQTRRARTDGGVTDAVPLVLPSPPADQAAQRPEVGPGTSTPRAARKTAANDRPAPARSSADLDFLPRSMRTVRPLQRPARDRTTEAAPVPEPSAPTAAATRPVDADDQASDDSSPRLERLWTSGVYR